MNRLLLLIVLGFCLFSCQTPQPDHSQNSRSNSPESMTKPYVVMVSMDGFRYDYASRYQAKNILRIAHEGIQAKAMIPSFPSSTFPNHYTLATGMYPSTHGIVYNSFYDPDMRESYKISDRSKVEDGQYYGGTPLWVLAEKSGMLSASFFWVGSEADVQETHPTYYFRYDGSIPNEKRIDQVIEWLKLPEEKRPHMITLYFSDTDDAGHKYGPETKETKEAVQKLDRQIGELERKLNELNLPINLILTADHGMIATRNDSIILPERLADLNDFEKIVRSTTIWMLHSQDSTLVESAYKELKKRQIHFKTYKVDEIPKHLHFENNDRIGQIVLISEAPYLLGSWGIPSSIGQHGFDPSITPEMQAIFYAKGPGLKKGLKLPPFENIHVYPLVAQLLDLPIPENIDGQAAVLDTCLLR